MGGLVPRGSECFDDILTGADVGPPQAAFLPEDRVYSLESALMPGHFVRHRGSELWADPRGKEASELYAYDASFVLVGGLLGHACSFRSTNFPLEFVRRRDAKVCIGEYDGSEDMRGDATFELRASEVDADAAAFESSCSGNAPSCSSASQLVCIMLATCPGKYLSVDKDGRLVAEAYDHIRRLAFVFRAVPGLALEWSEELDEPLVYQDGGPSDDALNLQGWDAACIAAKSLLTTRASVAPASPAAEAQVPAPPRAAQASETPLPAPPQAVPAAEAPVPAPPLAPAAEAKLPAPPPAAEVPAPAPPPLAHGGPPLPAATGAAPRHSEFEAVD